mmetsp:Transcript_25962/g.90374  ORF Transcript_25962/g.90374 Transcript_25962/m.90374 type:complete len:214 (-) Transcript_25962:140-781(-)
MSGCRKTLGFAAQYAPAKHSIMRSISCDSPGSLKPAVRNARSASTSVRPAKSKELMYALRSSRKNSRSSSVLPSVARYSPTRPACSPVVSVRRPAKRRRSRRYDATAAGVSSNMPCATMNLMPLDGLRLNLVSAASSSRSCSFKVSSSRGRPPSPAALPSSSLTTMDKSRAVPVDPRRTGKYIGDGRPGPAAAASAAPLPQQQPMVRRVRFPD